MDLPKIILLLCLLATFFIGCTDHDPEPDRPDQPEQPQVERPVVVTRDMTVLNPDQFRFGISLLNIAPNSIQQYGVAYSLHEYDVLKSHTDKPNVDWSRILFTGNAADGVHSKNVAAPASTFFRIYDRAYAILSDDSVVYGVIK